MLIAIKAHRYGPFLGNGTLGRDILYSWIGSPAREVLAGMAIEYVFRGFHIYEFNKPPNNWIEYVIAITESDFDLIKIALGTVRMFTTEEAFTQIMVLKDRINLRMPTTGHEPWEWELSSPPRWPTLLAARSSMDLYREMYQVKE